MRDVALERHKQFDVTKKVGTVYTDYNGMYHPHNAAMQIIAEATRNSDGAFVFPNALVPGDTVSVTVTHNAM